MAYTLKRVSVHDPSIVWEPVSQTYYIFGSHRAAAKTTDLMNWTAFTAPWGTASSNNAANSAAFTNPAVKKMKKGGNEVDLPAFNAHSWSAAIAKNGNVSWGSIDGNMWAPDVIWNPVMKKWCMYLSINGILWNSSIILLTADNIEGPYQYQAPVVISGFNVTSNAGTNYKLTDLELALGEQSSLPDRYNVGNKWGDRWPHCIDPCVFYDEQGKLWMSYGSWSGGIWMLELDENTGLRDYDVTYELKGSGNGITVDPYFGKKIAGGYYASGEASYIEHIGGYYYLFVTNGGLAAGGNANDYNNGGYQMRVFRSENPDGPYTDSHNNNAVYPSYLLNFGPNENDNNRGVNIFGAYNDWGNQIKGNYGERSQGHNSIIAAEDGRTYLVYHTRFQNLGEGHQVRVHQVFQNKNGWLVAAPFEYTGEQVKSDDIATTQQIATDKIAGCYKLLIHKYKLNHLKKETVTPIEIELKSNGTIIGASSGTWSIEEGTSYITLKIANTTYHGVMVEQTMEPKDTKTPAFTALAETSGVTVWGYRFAEPTASQDDNPEEPEEPTESDYMTGLVAYYNFDASPITNLLNTAQTAALEKEGDNAVPTLKSDAEQKGSVIHTNFGAAGNTSHVKFANPLAGTTLSEGASVSFWLNPIDMNLWDAIFSFYNTKTTARIYMTPNAYVGYNDMANSWIDLNHPDGYESGYINFGDWNFITFTISCNEGIKVYVNGELKEFQKCAGSLNGTNITVASTYDYRRIVNHITSSSDFYFGYGSFWGSLNADYDELLIHNRVLTANDAKALYQAEAKDGFISIGKGAGDANGDGTVNAADIVEVVNYIMGKPSDKFDAEAADANHDGTVNAADIVYIVNLIMK
jgi:arabinan endo-1,5-alpha-L-arabinosidase